MAMYVHIYIYIYMYGYRCIYVHGWQYSSRLILANDDGDACAQVETCQHICIYACIYIFIYIDMCTYMYVCYI